MAEYDYKEAMKPENQLCFPLYAAARHVVNLYVPWLKPLGLTYTQYIVLLVLWEKDGLTVGRICDRLMLDSGTLTPLLKKLQSAGYVEKRRNENDEREVVITLTESGRELQSRAAYIPASVGGCLNLNSGKASELYGLLYELLENETNKKEI